MTTYSDDHARKCLYEAMVYAGANEVLRRELEDATCEEVAQRVFGSMLSVALSDPGLAARDREVLSRLVQALQQ